jgi:hypothetical protein
MHSVTTRAQNVDALFFMGGWGRYGYDEKHDGRCYAELLFLLPVGSASQIVHFGASRARNFDALF